MPDYPDTRVYVVIWHDEQIVKAGYTKRPSRLSTFTNRGAFIWSLIGFPTARLATAYEATVLAYFDAVTTPRFAHLKESRPFLGASGVGYTECYRNAPGMLQALPEAFGGHCYVGDEVGYGRQSLGLSTDVRTDGLTDENSIWMNPSPNASPAGAQGFPSSLDQLFDRFFRSPRPGEATTSADAS